MILKNKNTKILNPDTIFLLQKKVGLFLNKPYGEHLFCQLEKISREIEENESEDVCIVEFSQKEIFTIQSLLVLDYFYHSNDKLEENECWLELIYAFGLDDLIDSDDSMTDTPMEIQKKLLME